MRSRPRTILSLMTPVYGEDGNDSLVLEQTCSGQLRRPGAFQIQLGSHRKTQRGRRVGSLIESPLSHTRASPLRKR